ncbi:MAG TPA: hypothetical protein DEF34_10725 [Desulfotomaculum sp.]|nr:MAG: hypothetical protein JL56_04170 [Desulfotomaculum sp. BICA1-6]HBX24086.1 hypothetical protein [Desulfotomaculum sp.]
MFFRKVTSKSNGKEYTYLKLIENYREGNKVKQRVIANLGSLEKLTPDKVNGLITGLSKICGLPNHPNKFEAQKTLRYGEVLAIHKVWELLGVEPVINKVAGLEDDDIVNVSLLVELMAINQIIQPQHKEAISDWYHSLYMPALEGMEILPHHFYRALDIVAEYKEELEEKVYANLRKLMHINTNMAFCRLTTGTIEPAPREELNLSSYGKYVLGESEELQRINFGLLVSGDGVPLGHSILREIAEEWEYRNILDYLKNSFDIDKCIFVGDRSVLDNPGLEVLVAQGYDYIIGRKHMTELERDLIAGELNTYQKGFHQVDEGLWFKEIRNEDAKRYMLCYNPGAAEQTHVLLRERLDAIENELKEIQKTVGEKRFLKAKNIPLLKDSHFRKYFDWRYSESTQELAYRRREDLIVRESGLAGSFLLETNNEFLQAVEIVKAYTSLTIMGESFREIKNFEPWQNILYAELKISANLFICVLGFMMEKLMERMINQAGLNLDVRQAINLLEDIKVAINQLDDHEIKSVSSLSPVQENILTALGLFKDQRVI